MVEFSFISARFLNADDANEAFATPSEHNSINLHLDPTKSDKADLSIVFSVVDPLQSIVCKDLGGGQKRDAVLGGLILALSSSHSNSTSKNHTA